jgi:hypothetical protein
LPSLKNLRLKAEVDSGAVESFKRVTEGLARKFKKNLTADRDRLGTGTGSSSTSQLSVELKYFTKA